MPASEPPRIGYVVKRYPRLSETFIVTEILAHEAAGLQLDIFALRSPVDGRFHEALGRVRAHVTYLPHERIKLAEFWTALAEAKHDFQDLWTIIDEAEPEEAATVYQAVLLAREVRTRNLTHLHAHFGSVATSVARLTSRLTGVPYTFTAHAKDIFHESVNEEDMRRKLQDAAAVITVSDFNLAYLRTAFGEDASRVHRIYNGLDLEEFGFAPPIDRLPIVLAVGRLVEKKGFADLIEACAILAQHGCDFRCEIIGDGELAEPLREQIEQSGLTEHVRLLGPRPRGQVIARIRQAAVMVVPSVIAADGNRDGLPTVLLEAMALGTPCIATDVTGIPEIVRDGETGLIVPQHAPQALADRMEALLADPSSAESLAANARKLIERDFDIHRNTAAMRQFFGVDRLATQAAVPEAV
ncbi:MAG: glycosyltransferase [Phycisphaerales bacterium]|nr:MAG: glycosyltransferase [Phycisphaerales bacterium]